MMVPITGNLLSSSPEGVEDLLKSRWKASVISTEQFKKGPGRLSPWLAIRLGKLYL